MHDIRHRRPGAVEDYTHAFLAMAGLLLFSTLVLVWGLWGYAAALALCAGLHALLARHRTPPDGTR